MLKKMIAISLTLLILAVSAKDFVMLASFKVNQDFIAKVLCINQDKPELQCNGKCYLNKKIAEEKEREDSGVPVPLTEDQKQIVYFFEAKTARPSNDGPALQPSCAFKATSFRSQDFFQKIFQPPRTPLA